MVKIRIAMGQPAGCSAPINGVLRQSGEEETSHPTLERLLNSPWTPYLFGFIGCTLMWRFQVVLVKMVPQLDYALGVSLIFLPAGVRTLSVLIFGARGAVGVFLAAILSTVEYMGHIVTMDFAVHVTISIVSAFSAWIALLAVCRLRKIGDDLSQICFSDVVAIAFTQGLLSATLHQFLYRWFHIDATFAAESWENIFLLWSGMATGDIVGSMVFVLAAISSVSFIQSFSNKERMS